MSRYSGELHTVYQPIGDERPPQWSTIEYSRHRDPQHPGQEHHIPDKSITQGEAQIHEDLKALESIRSILSMSSPVGFIIITFPTWILHEDWPENFIKTVRILLENRFWVQLKQVSLQSHGVPRHGTSLILLASSVPSPVLWDTFDEAFEASALDKIRGLEPNTSSSGFVCTRNNDSTCPDIDVFNHRTGIRVSHPSPNPLTASLDMNDVHRTTHPGMSSILPHLSSRQTNKTS